QHRQPRHGRAGHRAGADRPSRRHDTNHDIGCIATRPDGGTQAMSAHLSYVEAVIVGAFQGVTELFPVSSLGHAVLVPALVGGRWAHDLNVSPPESPYLAFIVGLHVATAAALLVFFWRDWLRILAGFVSSIRHPQIRSPHQRVGMVRLLGTTPR